VACTKRSAQLRRQSPAPSPAPAPCAALLHRANRRISTAIANKYGCPEPLLTTNVVFTPMPDRTRPQRVSAERPDNSSIEISGTGAELVRLSRINKRPVPRHCPVHELINSHSPHDRQPDLIGIGYLSQSADIGHALPQVRIAQVWRRGTELGAKASRPPFSLGNGNHRRQAFPSLSRVEHLLAHLSETPGADSCDPPSPCN